MVDSLILKTASLLDLETACEVLEAQFAEHDIVLAPDALRAAVEGLVTDERRGALVLAWEGETPVGLAVLATTWTLEHGGLVGWLDELYVRPARRSRGIGTALLERTCALAHERGCLALELEVDAAHGRAARLYERAGFGRLARSRWSRRLEPPAR